MAEMLRGIQRERNKYLDMFSKPKDDCMQTDLAQQCIDSGTAAQIHLSLFPNSEERQVAEQMFNKGGQGN